MDDSKYPKPDNNWHYWIASMVKCLWCNLRWAAVYPDDCVSLTCPGCGIETDVALLEDNGDESEFISA